MSQRSILPVTPKLPEGCEWCPECGGDGYTYTVISNGVPGDWSERRDVCPTCDGVKYVETEE